MTTILELVLYDQLVYDQLVADELMKECSDTVGSCTFYAAISARKLAPVWDVCGLEFIGALDAYSEEAT